MDWTVRLGTPSLPLHWVELISRLEKSTRRAREKHPQEPCVVDLEFQRSPVRNRLAIRVRFSCRGRCNPGLCLRSAPCPRTLCRLCKYFQPQETASKWATRITISLSGFSFTDCGSVEAKFLGLVLSRACGPLPVSESAVEADPRVDPDALLRARDIPFPSAGKNQDQVSDASAQLADLRRRCLS
ncbi:hypothetical protein VTI74DRAFT_10847 [Chaetomium olivicolor]